MEQLLEQYKELEKRNTEELEHDQSITHLLYIEGFKWDDLDKIKKINKISQSKIEKRITLVQDVRVSIMQFGTLRKDAEPYARTNEHFQSLVKDIDMHINCIMFEIDKLEQLKQKSQRFLRLQSQPNIKPETAPTDAMAQTGGLLSSTSDGQTRMYQSSFQFYRAQRDQQIQSHNQKWIEKQYTIQKKLIESEKDFQKFRYEIDSKQKKAEMNLQEFQLWQQRVLKEQEEGNSKRLQLHKERVLKDQVQRQAVLEQKMSRKELQLQKQMSLLKDFHEVQKQQKEVHFLKIIQKSMTALNDKDKFNQHQKELNEKKEQQNQHKLKYIEESKEWTKQQLQRSNELKQKKIDRANQILVSQDLQRREKFESKEKKKLAYMDKYKQMFEEYQNHINKEKEGKIHQFQINKAIEDASREQLIKYQFERKSQSQAEAQRLRDRRIRIYQEEKAGEQLMKQIEINQRLNQIQSELEMKRRMQELMEEEQKQRKLMIENDERQTIKEREKMARKLEMEKEQKDKEMKKLKYSKF
ncbi:unnamed protein product (macronuclear) [Paramecium tetraurelia]|uniref:Trichohyalin-plectin-homology domain-containing protein n=1 Tax=Paramecium tetraurelia TaxID=5888 RepID=A0CLA5_PARTE|nr:uncharacterized protein GSPATT00008119001 [Paramecium tetraurelia]CAK71572.1 unnamed protein product [Paramecium tetraurelia]|eukprot:XP_001438969.1 hypothetical protein (macronuclear) [Paramecium tetraurelia strain d4-2]